MDLLGRIAQNPCLLEPFCNQPTVTEVRSCLLKLFHVQADYQRQSRRKAQSLPEAQLPQLWILASSASERLLQGFGAVVSEHWPVGVYFLPSSLRTAMIAINQLPCNDETLWLRLMGKGKTQQGAISEVLALSSDDPKRSSILRLLANWKISIEITGQAQAQKELMMVLSQAYLEWEQQTEQRGRQEGELAIVLRLLTRRVGLIAPEAESQIRNLSLTQLGALGEALLDFSQPSDLEDWLQVHT